MSALEAVVQTLRAEQAQHRFDLLGSFETIEARLREDITRLDNVLTARANDQDTQREQQHVLLDSSLRSLGHDLQTVRDEVNWLLTLERYLED